MSRWFTCNLGDAMLAVEPLGRIEALFRSEYGEVDCPEESALFFRHESEGRLHCELKVYFTPAAVRVAEAVGAIPCDRPAPNGLGLLAGPEAAWSVYFPGDTR